MGITLSGAIQVYYDAKPELSMRAHWDTVCIWEFNKDYLLMQDLGNHRTSLDNDWPDDSKYSDCLQMFTPKELPTTSDSHRYIAMRSAVVSLVRNNYKVRILFWRD